MKTGRNDPCPCGSGQKYKRCCLRDGSDTPRPDPQQARDDLQAPAFAALLRFANRPQFRDARIAAFERFVGDHGPDDLGDGEEPIDEDVHLKFSFFYLFDLRLPDGRTIAETFLQRAGGQVDARERALIERFGAGRLRLYEVQEVRVDEGLRLRDLWADREVWVAERAGTRQLTRWDLLAARAAPDEGGTLRLEGGIYLLPSRLKRRLLGALRAEAKRLRRQDPALDEDRLFREAAPHIHRLWLDHVVHRKPPTFVTAEGDPLVFGKVVFDVIDRAGVEAALRDHAEIEEDEDARFLWREDADAGFARSLGTIALEDDDRLVLEVTSRARAERGRRLLEEAAGGALRHRATRFEGVQRAIGRLRSQPRPKEESPVPPEEASRVVSEFKRRHYASWPDQPLPALDGRTPRHAARLKTLRPRLVDLLKELENHELRRARPDDPPYDFGWIWTDLGLERQA